MTFGTFSRLFFASLAVSVVVLAPGNEARASLVFYNTTAGYGGATTGNTDVNFAGLAAPGSFTAEPTPPGLTANGVNFTVNSSVSNAKLFVIGAGFGPHYGTSPVLSSQGATTGGDNLVITLPGSFTSFSFLGNAFDNSSGTFLANPLTVTLSTGDSFALTPASDGSYTFLGVTSTVAFTSITITDSFNDSQASINLADFKFGTALVPEPSSLVLAGLGLIGVLGQGLRRGRVRTRG